MRKHTNTTQLIGSRYPLSLRLRDAWYHYGESTAIVALLIMVALIGGALRRHYDPAPAYAELKPIILMATPTPAPIAPVGAPVVAVAGIPTADPIQPTAVPAVEQPAAPVVEQRAVVIIQRVEQPEAPTPAPEVAAVAPAPDAAPAAEPEQNRQMLEPIQEARPQLQMSQYTANNGANYSAACIALKDQYKTKTDGTPIPVDDFRALVNCQLRGTT